jgi:hypothetical protein
MSSWFAMSRWGGKVGTQGAHRLSECPALSGFIVLLYIHIDILYIYMHIYICIHTYDICYCVFIVRNHVLECLNAKTREFGSLKKKQQKKNNSGAKHPTFWRYSTLSWTQILSKRWNQKRWSEKWVFCRGHWVFWDLGTYFQEALAKCSWMFLISMRTEGSASESF